MCCAVRGAAMVGGHDRERRSRESRPGSSSMLRASRRPPNPIGLRRSSACCSCPAYRCACRRAELRRARQYTIRRRPSISCPVTPPWGIVADRSGSSRRAVRSVIRCCRACSAASDSRTTSQPVIPATSTSAIHLLSRGRRRHPIDHLPARRRQGRQPLSRNRTQGARRRKGADRL